MTVIRDVLRLESEERYKFREIAESLSISHQTVSKHIKTVLDSGLDLAGALELSDQELKALIYPKTPGPKSPTKISPDFGELIKELAKHPSLTRKVLWDEYRSQYGTSSYSYCEFCVQMRQTQKSNSLTMHIEHAPADKLFIDFALTN